MTQINLIFKLHQIRESINKAKDTASIIELGKEAYTLVFPVPIDKDFGYKIEGKNKTLLTLNNELRSYEKSNTEMEVIQFQIASSVLMLMLSFIQGSLERLNEMIAEYKDANVA